MAATRDFAPIVKAILAEMSQSHAIHEIRVTETLLDLGISPDLIPELALRLYRTVGGSMSGDYRDFADSLAVGSDSTVRDIAAHFARASSGPETVAAGERRSGRRGAPKASNHPPPAAPAGDLPADRGRDVETAVLVAVAGASRTHSFEEIQPNHTLGQLGLDDVDFADVRNRVYRMLSSARMRPPFLQYCTEMKIAAATTIGDVVAMARTAFQPLHAADIAGAGAQGVGHAN